LKLKQRGKLTYLTVCTGCHSYNNRLIGPPMVAARALYIGKPQALGRCRRRHIFPLPGVTRISRYHEYRVLMVEPKIVPRFLCEFASDSPQAFIDAHNRLNERPRAAGAMIELFQEQSSAAYQLVAEVSAR
jgi:hypothetical protein